MLGSTRVMTEVMFCLQTDRPVTERKGACNQDLTPYDVSLTPIDITCFYFQARIQTACELIERIGKKRGELVQRMRHLCEAYIELAYVNVSHLKNERGNSFARYVLM